MMSNVGEKALNAVLIFAGILQFDDNTVIDSQGNIIHQPKQPHGSTDSHKAVSSEDVVLLPRVSGRNRNPD